MSAAVVSNAALIVQAAPVLKAAPSIVKRGLPAMRISRESMSMAMRTFSCIRARVSCSR